MNGPGSVSYKAVLGSHLTWQHSSPVFKVIDSLSYSEINLSRDVLILKSTSLQRFPMQVPDEGSPKATCTFFSFL